jgi:hypothetical protein
LPCPSGDRLKVLLKSSAPVELSESETEYVVSAVKHIFKEHIVVQYDIKNTLPDTILENVTVVATPEEEDVLEDDFIIPAPKLPTDQPGVVYVAFKKLNGDNSVPITSFNIVAACQLQVLYLVLVVVATVLGLAACRVDFFAGELEDI